MSKIKFIEEIELIKETLSDEAKEYFETLKTDSKSKTDLTDNGKIVLKTLQELVENGHSDLSSKEIADQSGLSSRTVSGAFRKLINDGYVSKFGSNPVMYSLTDEGKEKTI